jgi:hypothetical protein
VGILLAVGYLADFRFLFIFCLGQVKWTCSLQPNRSQMFRAGQVNFSKQSEPLVV